MNQEMNQEKPNIYYSYQSKKSSRGVWVILLLGMILWGLFVLFPQWFVLPQFGSQPKLNCPYGVLDC